MKTLLYITNQTCGPGGLERVLSIKASQLAEAHNYNVNVITLNQDTQSSFYHFSSKIKFHNFTVAGNPVHYVFQYINKIRKLVNSIKPDIISVCDDGLKGFFLPLILRKPCPMIYERHVSKNIEIRQDNHSFKNRLITKIKFGLMNFSGKYYDKFVVLTKGNLKEWHFNNLAVIPNPLSFYPNDDDISNVMNKRVIAVGKHSYQKGFDRLLKSWQMVNKKQPGWILEIYGTINEKEGLLDLAKTLDISSSVNFFHPVKNIGEKYKAASIYVMSSRYEGFGMVLIEAMAYGVPCVSFDCPYGPSDIITNNEDGFILPNHNIDKLAHKIIELIKNEDLRIQMGTKSRENVKQYLPEIISKKWHDLFTELLSNRAA